MNNNDLFPPQGSGLETKAGGGGDLRLREVPMGQMFAADTPPPPARAAQKPADTGNDPSGHRSRLRKRLLEGGAEALADHEVIEYLLMTAIPRKDTKPIATGDAVGTTTQAMTGQVDIGWCVAPFNLDLLERGEIRMIGRLSDLAHLRAQTIRVQIANAQALVQKKDAFARYLAAYREVLDWMYASDDAMKKYIAITGLPEASVRRMLAEFIPKESLQIDEVRGVPEAMQDAVQFKFLNSALTEAQLAELIQVGPPH